MSQETNLIYYAHNVGATTYVYGRYRGPQCGNGNLKTTGSSITVDATGGGQTYALSPIGVGDIIALYRAEQTIDKVKVATKPDADTITVSAAVNWENGGVGYGGWNYWKYATGTSLLDGWIDVKRYRRKTLNISITSLGETDGITYRLEGLTYGPNPQAVLILPEVTIASAAAPYSETIAIGEDFSAIRLGLKRVTATTGTDVIDVTLIGDPVGAGV